MLSQLEKTRQQVAGKHQAVDAWLEARRTLLIGYMQLAGIGTARTTLPSCQQVHGFCQQLLDYICAGHFEIYDHVVSAFEQASGRSLSLANRIIPRIQLTTEMALQFNDKYGEAVDEEELLELDGDLDRLGQALEERFRLEDRLVKVLRVLDDLTTVA